MLPILFADLVFFVGDCLMLFLTRIFLLFLTRILSSCIFCEEKGWTISKPTFSVSLIMKALYSFPSKHGGLHVHLCWAMSANWRHNMWIRASFCFLRAASFLVIKTRIDAPILMVVGASSNSFIAKAMNDRSCIGVLLSSSIIVLDFCRWMTEDLPPFVTIKSYMHSEKSVNAFHHSFTPLKVFEDLMDSKILSASLVVLCVIEISLSENTARAKFPHKRTHAKDDNRCTISTKH